MANEENAPKTLLDSTVEELENGLRKQSQRTIFGYNDVLNELNRRRDEERETRELQREMLRVKTEAARDAREKARDVREDLRDAKQDARDIQNDLNAQRQDKMTRSNYVLSFFVAVATIAQAIIAYLAYIKPS